MILINCVKVYNEALKHMKIQPENIGERNVAFIFPLIILSYARIKQCLQEKAAKSFFCIFFSFFYCQR